MQYYVDNSNSDLLDNNGEPMTPYHRYLGTNDFNNILNDIAKGLIPTATGQPFSVEDKPEFEQISENPFGGKDNPFLKMY